jgi:hypothetical protein
LPMSRYSVKIQSLNVFNSVDGNDDF